MFHTFKVKGGTAQYGLEDITPEQAAAVGCQGATVRRIGNHDICYGTTREVTGRAVRVPGWPSSWRGILTDFTPWGSTETLRGWVG